jgi:subtilisin family serine protease
MLKNRRRRAAAALAALVTAAAVPAIDVGAAPGNGQGNAYGNVKRQVAESPLDSYLVVMQADPLLGSFDQADLQSAAARQQASEMAASHAAALAAVGASADSRTYSYTNAVNGFAANISHDQAEKLTGVAGVAMVVPNELQQATTDQSGTFLGLNAAGGAYDAGLTGEDVVIGVIDSGIWPEHPSFADGGAYDAPPITIAEVTADDYLGIERTWEPCAFGNTEHELAEGLEDYDFTCNNKLIGARWVLDSYVENVGLTDVEYASARDENGHGTHTASTAGGNAGVEAEIFEIDRGVVTGIAPRARIVAYKALGELGGTSADLAMAIDLAVADGVDVINYSIGSSSFAVGVDDVAFLFAAAAGVHVATSNGNAGPGAATTGSPASAPWVTSVGASTHDRTYEGSVTVGLPGDKPKKAPAAPITVYGASLTPGTGVVQIVDAADFGNELCLSNVPFHGTVAGKIVLCRRGENARIDKSFAVYQAGGAGMVLYNVDDVSDLVTDNHWVPSVHVNLTDGLAVKEAIAAGKKVYAQLAAGAATERQGSAMAAFSSRGPNLLTSDIIKPDVTAPGVNILAGNTPTPVGAPPGQLFQAISGTSMSSPHVAGLLALFDQLHPDWTAAAAKSALMTTARQDVVKEDGTTAADPFDMGAGHVDPSGSPAALGTFFNPGIVYDSDTYNPADGAPQPDVYFYAQSTCVMGLGVFSSGTCAFLASRGLYSDMSDYNAASIGIGELPGSQTVTRRIRNVSGGDLSLTPVVEAPAGYAVSVEPAVINIAAGASTTFDVTISNVSAPVGEWAFGSLTLEGGGFRRTRRSPCEVLHCRPRRW